jgi:hypothetical protein
MELYFRAVEHSVESWKLVQKLPNYESLVGELLFARHVEYGVQPAHYIVVETALLRTLEGGLQEHWTTDLRKEWAAVFQFVANAMMLGAGNEPATLHLKVMKQSERTMLFLSCSGMSIPWHFDGVKKAFASK